MEISAKTVSLFEDLTIVLGVIISMLVILNSIQKVIEKSVDYYEALLERKNKISFIIRPTIEDLAIYGAPISQCLSPEERQEEVYYSTIEDNRPYKKGSQSRLRVLLVFFSILYATLIWRLLVLGIR